ncbi:MAG: HEPN domain-containing protein [Nanoarchaeota archaeon]
MNEQSFLSKLKKEKVLKSVEPSEEIKESYLKKASDCLTAAKILYNNKLYENSIGSSYYTMYDGLTALLFKVGIKCENHNGSITIFKTLFNQSELLKIIVFGKEERIDKQYYPSSKDNPAPTEESTKDMISKAENFLIKIRVVMNSLSQEEIIKLRERFEKI